MEDRFLEDLIFEVGYTRGMVEGLIMGICLALLFLLTLQVIQTKRGAIHAI